MPKVIESKIVIKGEDSGASTAVERVTDSFTRLTDVVQGLEKVQYETEFRLAKVLSLINKELDQQITKRQRIATTRLAKETGQLTLPGIPMEYKGRSELIPAPRHEPVPVRIININELRGVATGGGGLVTGLQGTGRRISPLPSGKGTDEMPYWVRRLITQGPQQAMNVATGGTSGLGGLLMSAGGIAAKNPLALIGLAGVAALGAGIMHATSLAERSMAIERPLIPLYYRGFSQERVGRMMQLGQQFGYGPEEVGQYLGQFERFGGIEAFQPMARLRYRGFEMQGLAPFIQTATQMGAAGARTEKDYEKLAKVVALAFADKGLPSVEQAVEQLTGIMQTQGQYLADLNEDQVRYLAGLVQAGEASPSSMFKGARGVQTWATIQSAIAGTQDPGHMMMMYSTMARNPGLKNMVLGDIFGKKGAEGMTLTPFRAQMVREDPRAMLAMIQGYTAYGTETGAEMLYDLFGGKLSARQSFELAKISGSVGTNIERFQQEAAKAGIDLKDLEGKKKDEDWRQKDAEMKLRLYTAGQKLTDEVVNLKNGLSQLNEVLIPVLRAAVSTPKNVVKAFGPENPFNPFAVFQPKFWENLGVPQALLKALSSYTWEGSGS